MLILARRQNERIQIGPDVTITICSASRVVVRVGIEAPPELAVVRLGPVALDEVGEGSER